VLAHASAAFEALPHIWKVVRLKAEERPVEEARRRADLGAKKRWAVRRTHRPSLQVPQEDEGVLLRIQ
jgi:hypothetical protein